MPTSAIQRAVLVAALLIVSAGAVAAGIWNSPGKPGAQSPPPSSPGPTTSAPPVEPTAVPSPPPTGPSVSVPSTAAGNGSETPVTSSGGRHALPATGVAADLALLGTVFMLAGGALVWIEERTRLLGAVGSAAASGTKTVGPSTRGRRRGRHRPQHSRSRR